MLGAWNPILQTPLSGAWGGAYEGINAGGVSPECARARVERLKRGDTVLAVSASQVENGEAMGILSSRRAREICRVG